MDNGHVILVGGVRLSNFKYNHRDSDLPLGLLSIAAVLRKQDYTVDVLDFNLLIKRNEISTGPDFYERAAEMILDKQPDYVGFHSAVGVHHHALQIADEVTDRDSELTVLLGGPHASFVDEATVANFPQIDYILRGEAEQTFPELLETLRNGGPVEDIDGITYAEDREVRRNDARTLLKNLDELPIPAYDAYDVSDIENERIPIEVGRGCPYHCSFCSTSFFWRRSYRLKSVERIIDEIRYLYDNFDSTKFFFMHDNLTANRELTTELCERIEAMDIDIRWGCAARIDHIDEELLNTMDNAGCDLLEFGIESMSNRIQEKINKNLSESDIRNLLQELENRDFFTVLYFIGGFPYERKADLFKSLDFIVEVNRNLAGSVYTRMTRLRAFSGTKTIDEERDSLIYGPTPLNNINTEFYPDEYLQLARDDHTLFPELYHFENEEDLRLGILQQYINFVNTFVVFTSTYLPYTFEKVLQDFDAEWEAIADSWTEFYDDTLESGGWNALPSNIHTFLRELYSEHDFEFAEALDDLIDYELAAYRARNFLITNTDDRKEGEDTLRLRPGVTVIELEHRIEEITQRIKGHNDITSAERHHTVYVFRPESSEDVTIIRPNSIQHTILQQVDGPTSVDNLRNAVLQRSSVDEQKQIDNAIVTLQEYGILV